MSDQIRSRDYDGDANSTSSNTAANSGAPRHTPGGGSGSFSGLAIGKDEVELKKEANAAQAEKESEGASVGGAGGEKGKGREPPRDPTGIIDMDILEQVLEMDEEEDEEEGAGSFSKTIVFGYFEQAGTTFDEMKAALAAKDLPTLSSLGHFLKGSSAALGIAKVKDSCEKMQHYGNMRDEEAGKSLSESEALSLIGKLLVVVEEEYDEAAEWLKRYYREREEGA